MRSDWRSSAAGGLALTCALLMLPTSRLAAAGEREDGRYTLTRTRDALVRLDSATGRVWLSPLSGDGGWVALGTPPPAAGAPSETGRFSLRMLQASGGPRPGVPANDATSIFLGDLATGRAWIAEAAEGRSWIEIRAGSLSVEGGAAGG